MQVLVVEDDPSVSAALVQVLQSAGHECDVTSRGSDALLRVHRNDAVLLDLGLEDMDGFDVLHRLRKVTSIPVLVVTAHGEERFVVRGLRLGADDYLVKPVRMQELIARLDAARMRKRAVDPEPDRVEIGDLIVDMRSRNVSRGGVDVSLTRTEFDVLAVLARRGGEPVSREAILDEVWGDAFAAVSRSLDVHVTQLRAKIGEPSPISTIRGYGYRLGSRGDAHSH